MGGGPKLVFTLARTFMGPEVAFWAFPLLERGFPFEHRLKGSLDQVQTVSLTRPPKGIVGVLEEAKVFFWSVSWLETDWFHWYRRVLFYFLGAPIIFYQKDTNANQSTQRLAGARGCVQGLSSGLGALFLEWGLISIGPQMGMAQNWRARSTRILVFGSTYQGNPFWHRFF